MRGRDDDGRVPVSAGATPRGHLPPAGPGVKVPREGGGVWYHVQTGRLWSLPGGGEERAESAELLPRTQTL